MDPTEKRSSSVEKENSSGGKGGKLFSYKNRQATDRHEMINKYYELTITVVEFLAALLFLIGSIFFFYDKLMHAGTWMFVLGSVFFIIRPSVRLIREFHLASLPVDED